VLPVALLWSCLSQLVSALRAIHGAGLAVRSLDARHVLVTKLPPTAAEQALAAALPAGVGSRNNPHPVQPRWRVRINCVGVVEALESETRRHVYEWQQLDLRALGRLMVALATSAPMGQLGANLLDSDEHPHPAALAEAEAVLAQNYSRELHSLVVTLLRSGGGSPVHPHNRNAAPAPPSPSIRDVSRALWSHAQDESDRTYLDLDRVESALASEYDSSRILRLLLKLGYVNDRPELGPNRRWAQSGDCFVLSLFRDYGKFFFREMVSRAGLLE
jgi:PAB-dependent poly(A)-specific ribonuclease subunit 3